MKAIVILISIQIILVFSTISNAQDQWSKLSNFPGTARSGAVSAVVGDTGYFGTGSSGSDNLSDWWKYNPSSNEWMEVSAFPGTARKNAEAFVINDTIYVIGGVSGPWNAQVYHNDFYYYVPSEDSWHALDDFPGAGRMLAVSTVVGEKAYYGTGQSSADQMKDWWEFDVATKIWQQKADLASDKRQSAVAFTLDNTVFIGGGLYVDGGTYVTNNFYAYHPETDEWEEKSFAESHLTSSNAASCVIGDTAYFFAGSNNLELWKYVASTNSWTQGVSMVNGSEDNLSSTSSMVFDNYALIVGGSYFNMSGFTSTPKATVWKYFPDPPTRPIPPTKPEGDSYIVDYNFLQLFWVDNADNEDGYIVTIKNNNTSEIVLVDTLEADSESFETDLVEQGTKYYVTIFAYNEVGKSLNYIYHYPEIPMYLEKPMICVATLIGEDVARIGWTDKATREDGFIIEYSLNDTLHFEVADTVAANITQYEMPNLSLGQTYYFRVAAYIADTLKSDYTWRNPAVLPSEWGAWVTVASFSDYDLDVNYGDACFYYENKLYILNSWNQEPEKRYLNQWDLETSELSRLTTFPGMIFNPNFFLIGSKLYIAGGDGEGDFSNEVYMYDLEKDEWTKKGDFPGEGRISATTFVMDGKGYMVGGDTVYATSGNVQTSEIWVYDPQADTWTPKADFIGGNREQMIAYTKGDTVFLGMGNSYSGEIINGEWLYYKNYKDFYAYLPTSETYLEMAGLPVGDFWNTDYSSGSNSFLYGGGGTMYGEGGDFWEYDYNLNKWSSIASVKGVVYNDISAFRYADQKYIVVRSSENLSTYKILKYDPSQLSAVNSLTAEISLPNSIVLSWSSVDNDADGLIIQELFNNAGTDEFINIDTLNIDLKTYTIENLEMYSWHTYRIVLYNDQVTSEPSNLVTVSVPGPVELSQLSRTDDHEMSFRLYNYNSVLENIVEVSENDGSFIPIDTLISYQSSHQFIVSENIEKVAVRVISRMTSDFSFISDTLTHTSFRRPTEISASWKGDNEILVTWTNNSLYDEYYTIGLDSKTDSKEYVQKLEQGVYEAQIDLNTIGFESKEWVEINISYRFEGWLNDEEKFVTELSRILEPGNVRVSFFSKDKMKISWDDNSNIEEGFHVQQIIDEKNAEYATLATVAPDMEEKVLDISGLPERFDLVVTSFNDEFKILARSEAVSIDKVDGIITALENAGVMAVAYPNPAKGTLYLQSGLEKATYIITDIHGNLVTSGILSDLQQSISVNEWVNGMYIIQIGGEVHKIVVEH